MDKKEIIKSIDRTKVEKVHFKYPELASPEAENLIKVEYYLLLGIEKQLLKSRAEVQKLEELYKEKKKAFNDKSNLFDIEFAVTEKEHITSDSNIMFKGLGNDIIGRPRIS